jgi:hypothetical protein
MSALLSISIKRIHIVADGRGRRRGELSRRTSPDIIIQPTMHHKNAEHPFIPE